MAAIANDWLEPLSAGILQALLPKLYQTVLEAYRTQQVYPPADEIFRAFELTPL